MKRVTLAIALALSPVMAKSEIIVTDGSDAAATPAMQGLISMLKRGERTVEVEHLRDGLRPNVVCGDIRYEVDKGIFGYTSSFFWDGDQRVLTVVPADDEFLTYRAYQLCPPRK